MHTRTPRAFVAAAALALLASACTDTPTGAPAARAPGERASLASSSSGPPLVSTAVKYRDTGGKPARGRSGNAVVDAFAVLDKAGVTTLDFYTRHATDWWRYGYVNKAQIKAFAPDGQRKFTRNLVESDPWYGPNGPIPGQVLLHGLGRGDQIQLQANVEGIDAPRIDVVTVTEKVKRLPDLTVEMTAPAEAEAQTYVNVMGVVNERNGDMGTWAECELLVEDQVVDYAWYVWVDAGDAVTCATTVTFNTPGTYSLAMRVRLSWDREWDTENNTDTATIQVHGESPQFYTSASFEQHTSVDSSVYYDRWENPIEGWGNEYRHEYVETSTYQYAYMYAYMPAPLTGPVDVRVGMSTGGQAVHAAEWSHPGWANSWWCLDRWSEGAMLWLCSSGSLTWGSTTFEYSFMAGAVTYHSREYSRTWDDLSGDEFVYHWNSDYEYGDTVPLGDDWTFNVRLNTPAGEHDLSRALQLERGEPWSLSYPYECSTWEYADWGYRSTYCSGESHSSEIISGHAAD